MSSERPLSQSLRRFAQRVRPGLSFFLVMLAALAAFEVFNYSTTEHALLDLLGPIEFAGLGWSTILALAFCAIDFAGIARIFSPQEKVQEPREVWYLFGAWLVAATMNAILTWWGVSMAVANHTVYSSAIIDPAVIMTGVPVFVALMVWVIRILIIGSLARAIQGTPASNPTRAPRRPSYSPARPAIAPIRPAPAVTQGFGARASLSRKPISRPLNPSPRPAAANYASLAEPTYHSLSAAPKSNSTPVQRQM